MPLTMHAPARWQHRHVRRTRRSSAYKRIATPSLSLRIVVVFVLMFVLLGPALALVMPNSQQLHGQGSRHGVYGSQHGAPHSDDSGSFSHIHDDDDPVARAEVIDLQNRIDLVRAAIKRHQSLGEHDHVAGAKQVLYELEDELSELVLSARSGARRGGNGGYGLSGSADGDAFDEVLPEDHTQEGKTCISNADGDCASDFDDDNFDKLSVDDGTNPRIQPIARASSSRHPRPPAPAKPRYVEALEDDDVEEETVQLGGSFHSPEIVEYDGRHSLAKQNAGDDTDVLVVATIDGTIVGLDADTGTQLWSFDAGKSVISSHQNDVCPSIIIPGTDGSIFRYDRSDDDLEALASRSSHRGLPLGIDDDDFDSEHRLEYEVDSDGDLNAGSSRSSPATSPGPSIHRLPFDVSQLVAMFSFQAGPVEDSNFFIGEKTTTLFGLDPNTGTLKARFSAGEDPDQTASSSSTTRDQTLWLGRTDYRVRLMDQSGLQQWNFSISQYDSLSSSSGGGMPSVPGLGAFGGTAGTPGAPGDFAPNAPGQRFDPLEFLVTKNGKIARYYCSGDDAASMGNPDNEEVDLDTSDGTGSRGFEEDASDECNLPRWTVDLENPVSQMLTYPSHNPRKLRAQAFTLFDPKEGVDSQEFGDSEEDNGNDDPMKGVSLDRLPNNGLYAVVQTSAYQREDHSINPGFMFPFLPFADHLQLAPPSASSRAHGSDDDSTDSEHGYCIYGIDGYCLIHSHSAGLYNLYANPLQRQYHYQRQYNEDQFSRYYPQWALPAGTASRPPGFVPKSQVWLLMTITLSVGIAVTLVGLIAVRYARRLKRRQLLNLPPGYVQVGQGRLALCPEELIGQGCNGTMVFKGLLGSQEVAVKKMLKAFYNTADREIELLMSTNHPNVLRYFQREDFGEFIHLALELCEMSLSDALHERPEMFAIMDDPSSPPSRRAVWSDFEGTEYEHDEHSSDEDDWVVVPSVRYPHLPAMAVHVLRDMVDGVAHLHDLRIVHRDLKPQNVLLGKYVSLEKAKKQKQEQQALEEASGALPDASAEDRILDVHRNVIRTLSSGGTGDKDAEDWGRTHRAKISDMGLGKQLQGEYSSFGHHTSTGRSFSHISKSYRHRHLGIRRNSSGLVDNQSDNSSVAHVGTIGWQAPEVLRIRNKNVHRRRGQSADLTDSFGQNDRDDSEQYRLTRAVDIFSLGCIFFATAIPGQHPFGEPVERQQNILNGKRDLTALDRVPELQDLVAKMTNPVPLERPTAADLANHPFFWSSTTVLNFIQDVSDALERLDDIDHEAIRLLESQARRVIGPEGRWDLKLDTELRGDVGRHKSYDRFSLRSCLRMIRNKRHHFEELPDSIKPKLTPVPVGFLRYFTAPSRFPLLLIAVYNTVLSSPFLRQHSLMAPYLPASSGPAAAAIAALGSAGQRTAESAAGCLATDENRADSTTRRHEHFAGPFPTAEEWIANLSDDAALDVANTSSHSHSIRDMATAAAVVVLEQRVPDFVQRQRAIKGGHRYKCKLCADFEASGGLSCSKGDECGYAHGRHELRQAPVKCGKAKRNSKISATDSAKRSAVGRRKSSDGLANAKKTEPRHAQVNAPDRTDDRTATTDRVDNKSSSTAPTTQIAQTQLCSDDADRGDAETPKQPQRSGRRKRGGRSKRGGGGKSKANKPRNSDQGDGSESKSSV